MGNLDMMHYLLENGAAVETKDSGGQSLLSRAVRIGNLDMVRILVEHGANVNVSDILGHTLLTWAVVNGRLDIVCYLVEHGAAVDGRCVGGCTPLMMAIHDSYLDVVRFLVEYGANANTTDDYGCTPLMMAVHDGHLDMVRFLVEHGSNVNISDVYGVSPLARAVRIDHLDMARYLVEHGAVVDAIDSGGRTSLMQAAEKGNLDMVRYFMERGADVNTRDIGGGTSLMRAVHRGHLEMVRYLVEHGANVNASDSDCRTSLTVAAREGHLDIVRFLVEHGAAEDGRSRDSALGIATKFDRQEVVQFLLPLAQCQDLRSQWEHLDEHNGRPPQISSSWLIPPFEVEVEPFVDAGHIGGEYRGKWLDAEVVVKLFIDGAINASFVDEVRLWYQLRHPNILKLYGVCDTTHHLFVCEYASNGSLPEYLKSCDVENRTPWKFLYEAALGLEYLHERKIVHGNLRGSNILIGSDGLAMLSGFGFCPSSIGGAWSKPGAWVRWASHDILEGKQVSFESDVYALGMCIVEAISGEVPFNGSNDYEVKSEKTCLIDLITGPLCREICSTLEQEELLQAMCEWNPRKRLQMPAIVNKLAWFAEIEAATLVQHTDQPELEPLICFDDFDNDLWIQVQSMVDKSENDLYHQLWHEMELIYDAVNAEKYPWSTLQRFHDLLSECRFAIDSISHQTYVHRMSATRARNYSIQGLHRRISLLIQLVRPQDNGAETREPEWKRLCREQVEIFVSEASEACVMLSSVDSEKDRSVLVAVLRAELRNSGGKYTGKQLAVLQNAHNDIVTKSLEDVHHATTPEWFIPWFELEMNEMMTLGEGGFGSVIKAKWLDSEVVVKKLEIDSKDEASVDKKREMRQMFEHEVDIWFGLSHPHVVRLFGACHVGRPFFVCELAPHGTLVEYLRHHSDELWLKLREAALGVQYLHARGIVHGDLKGNNIMIGSDGKAKVTDFGLSGVFGDNSTDMMVSEAMHWVAPECMLKQKPTFASDIYSLAMCIIEALRVTNGEEDDLPWGKLPNAAVKFNVTRRHRLPPRPRNCLDEAWTLIERMCKSIPADRILIMTVVDELEKLADRHGDLNAETDQIASDNGEVRRSPSSVVNELAEMKNWIGKCDTRSDWEGDVLKNIYQLLWDRLEQVATQLLSDSEGTVIMKSAISDFSPLVEYSQIRTRAVLGINGFIPLIMFTELSLRGYALHRRLDKFMAAHAVPNDPSSLHDWTSACNTIMRVSNSPTPTPACSDDDCSANEETGDDIRMISSTEVVGSL